LRWRANAACQGSLGEHSDWVSASTKINRKDFGLAWNAALETGVNDEIHAPVGGVRDSGWGRTGLRSLDDFSDLIWINSHSGQRQYPF